MKKTSKVEMVSCGMLEKRVNSIETADGYNLGHLSSVWVDVEPSLLSMQ